MYLTYTGICKKKALTDTDFFLSCSLKDGTRKDFTFNSFISVRFVTSMSHFIIRQIILFLILCFE